MLPNKGEQPNSMIAHYLSPLSPYLADETIQEIMINTPDNIWIERRGEMIKIPERLTPVGLRSAITVLSKMESKDVKEGTQLGIIDTRLGNYRVSATLAPTSIDGDSMCIRKHGHVTTSIDMYAEFVANNPNLYVPREKIDFDVTVGGEPLKKFLAHVVKSNKNIIVSGGTSSGKTTFLNALIAEVPSNQRVVTIEQVPELNVLVPNRVRFEANPTVKEGVSMRDLLKHTLRYNPDRIIMGEVRGPEAFDLTESMNTGHDGGMATLHANDAMGAIGRMTTMMLTAGLNWGKEAILNQISYSIDYVIQMANHNGVRYVSEILMVKGYEDNKIVCEYLLGSPRRS